MIHFTGFEKFSFYECLRSKPKNISKLLGQAKKDMATADLLAIGLCYLNGQGVKKNAKEAVKWLNLAADYKDNLSYHTLGICHLYGIGAKQSTNVAIKWFRKAAELDDVASEFIIGYCYFAGLGIKKNYNEAVEWFENVFEHGANIAGRLRFLDHVIIMAFQTMAESGNARARKSYIFKNYKDYSPLLF